LQNIVCSAIYYAIWQDNLTIKDEILLDFRAAKINTEGAKALQENVIDYDGQKILKSIGLFGANASGKSNILKAIKFCNQLILDSHQYNEGTIFCFTPFRFAGYINKPSTFSINFLHDGVEFEYSFTLTTKEILKESLYHYPNGRRAKVFVRDETIGNDKSKIYSFADSIIPRPMDVATNTSKKTLFLSRASQMDRELGKTIYRFFLNDFLIGFAPLDFITLGLSAAKQLFAKNKDLMLYALSICDSDISDVHFVQEKKVATRTGLDPQNGTETSFSFNTFHKAVPEISFDLLGEESAGTTQLFSMLFFLLDAVKNGKTFMLDEFDLSLHTILAEFVIDLFHVGSKAQFLFTTHNTNLCGLLILCAHIGRV